VSASALELAPASAALQQAKEVYAARNPTSEARWRSATVAMPGGNTRTVLFYAPFPLCMERGDGAYLFDVDGHRYVDLMGEYTAGIYGHSNPLIQSAIIETLKNGLSLASHNRAEGDLANLICKRFDSIELIRFTNSGSEANLMAIATAIAWTQRRTVMAFAGSYHGGLLSFGSGRAAPINVPYDYIVAPYNDTDSVRQTIRHNKERLAAIIVEPMLGAGGCIPGEPGFLRMLEQEARASNAMLIFDEIQTSRLSPGGRQALLGIRPDLTTLGKYLGGGLSFGAFGGRRDLMQQFDPRRPGYISHAGTFNNNVLSMAAGFAGLSQVLQPAVLSELNGRGEQLMGELNARLKASGTDLFLTGLGSIMSFQCRGEPGRASEILSLLFFELLERGFYIAPRGLVALSLAISDSHLREFVAAVDAVVNAHRRLLCT
jgi:glutamate-1-semialdehyde 2,1-aminomutase